jgi:DNA mismatch repair protein MutS2
LDEKTLLTLEYDKVLERLAGYAAFSASAELARAIRPVSDLEETRRRQALTSEARRLYSINMDISVGGAHDIRQQVDLAAHRGVLDPASLLEVKNTLIAARQLVRGFEKHAADYPHLAEFVTGLTPPSGLVDSISRAISERGEIMDHASDKLASIRHELTSAHSKLYSRLERMVNDPKIAPKLQEPIITQRNGRYVIPLRSDFKGQVRSIIHDQSASGVTLFVEPLAVVELNNRLSELRLAEKEEERRILADLSDQIGRHASALVLVVESLSAFDLALMCAKYAEDLHAAEPVLEAYRPVGPKHPGSTICLYQARHPLLDPAKVVPIDVDLDDNTFALVITGPNTGGKTVTLKTVGLLAVMAQSGLHIPVQSGSRLSVFEDIFADIGDEQSIEQSLSTFSGHIRNVVRILNQANRRTLVLFDELGSGTDPQEGAALARAILIHLISGQVPCLVATHYPELKTFAHSTPGAINASMEFDLNTLRPTYHLTIGLPGRSNALLIAARLGLSEDIIRLAKDAINPDDLHADDLLDEIRRQRDAARQARAEAEQARSEARKQSAELKARLEKLEEERLAVLEKARQQAETEVEALQEELDEARRSLNRARQPLEALKEVREKVETLQNTLSRPPTRQVDPEIKAEPLKVGEKVRVRSLKMEGRVHSIGSEDVEVQLGALRVRVKPGDIQRGGEPEAPAAPAGPAPSTSAARTTSQLFHPSPGMELDLRGQRAEEALDMLETYLENAFMAGLPFVRIIHGKGTGKLRLAIRDALRHHPHVSSWQIGQEKEGGDGVTVAKLRTE